MKHIIKTTLFCLFTGISATAFCDHSPVDVNYTIDNYTNATVKTFYFDSALHIYGNGRAEFTSAPNTNKTYPAVNIWNLNNNATSSQHLQGCILSTFFQGSAPTNFTLSSIWRYGHGQTNGFEAEPGYYNSVTTTTGGCLDAVNAKASTYGLPENAIPGDASPSSQPGTKTTSGLIVGSNRINGTYNERGYVTFTTLSYADSGTYDIHYVSSVYCVNPTGKGKACPWFSTTQLKPSGNEFNFNN